MNVQSVRPDVMASMPAADAEQAQLKKLLVRMKDMSKIYPNGTTALQDVNLDISEGEFVSFVGPSGCGKSTVFKLITGLSTHTSGELEIMGLVPKEARKQNDVAFVFQEHTLLPWRSVLDNAAMPMELRGIPKKTRKEEAERVLELVGLSRFESRVI